MHARAFVSFVLRLSFVVAIALSTQALRATTVSVATSDGRTHQGVVDPRTSEQSLWLRHDEPNAALAFSIEWESIVQVTIDGQAVTPGELLPQLKAIEQPRPALSVLLGPVERRPAAVVAASDVHATQPKRIAALAIHAHVGNWDADAQADGIELIVAAYDRTGQACPVRGDLTVRLLGERENSGYGQHSIDGPNRSYESSFGELHRWTEPVKAQHFGDPRSQDATITARYRLPFRSLEPDADWRLAADAVVHASLGVAGQGRFEATAPVRLRLFDPFRDRLERRTGRRHFPIERAKAPSIHLRQFQPAGRSSFRRRSSF